MNNYINYITYFPFIGWMIIMFMKKDDGFALSHAKQGFVMATFFTICAVFLIFTTVFVPNNQRILKLVIVMIIYALYLLYFGLCIFGTIMIKKEKKFDFPVIKRFTDKLDI